VTLKEANSRLTQIIIICIIIIAVSYFGSLYDYGFDTNSVTFECEKLTGYSASEAHFHAIFKFLNTGDKDISLSYIQINISLVTYCDDKIVLASKETGTLFLPKSNEVFRVESYLKIDYTELEQYIQGLEFGNSLYQALVSCSDILIELSTEVKRGISSKQMVYSDSISYSNIEWT
jgi:LEA14-like dessication related protein